MENFPPVSDDSTIFNNHADLTQSPAFKIGTGDEQVEDNAFSDNDFGSRSTFKEFTWADYRDDSIVVEDASSAPLNRANEYGINALFAAADRDLPKIALQLLDKGADPNILGDQSRVPLHMAAKAGCEELIKKLLEKGSVTDHIMVYSN